MNYHDKIIVGAANRLVKLVVEPWPTDSEQACGKLNFAAENSGENQKFFCIHSKSPANKKKGKEEKFS